jgi:uncharacterized protein (UPF0332 family)
MCESRVPVTFCWKHYLELAEDLAKYQTDEARLRASISRAYYAAFCNARNYMLNKDNNDFPRKYDHHRYLVDYYKGELVESKSDVEGIRRKIGKDLDVMRGFRGNVDYDDEVKSKIKNLEKTTEDVLKRSKRVISDIERGGF